MRQYHIKDQFIVPMRSSHYTDTHEHIEKCTHAMESLNIEMTFTHTIGVALKGKILPPLGANFIPLNDVPILKIGTQMIRCTACFSSLPLMCVNILCVTMYAQERESTIRK